MSVSNPLVPAKKKGSTPISRRSARKQKSQTADVPPEQSDSDSSSDSGDPEIPDQEANYLPSITYNDYWSIEDELQLRRKWSKDDDFVVEKSDKAEATLYKK